jgi:quinol monooxygenase YgiN
MAQPFIFISTFRLKQGKLDAFKEMSQGLVEFVESNEPGVIAFNL